MHIPNGWKCSLYPLPQLNVLFQNYERYLFTTHGLPSQIVSDNGSGFTSTEFQQFLSDNGVRHTLTSPYHPSSNGLAERAVQTFKNAVSKLEGPMEIRLSKFLFRYRVTPQTTTGLSPSQLLMGRRLRTHLDLLHPDTTRRIQEKQQGTMIRKAPRKFQVNDKVYAKNFREGIPGVISKVTGPLSYVITTLEGLEWRRHVDHLKTRFPDIEEQHKEDDDDWVLMNRRNESVPTDACHHRIQDQHDIPLEYGNPLIDIPQLVDLKRGKCGNCVTIR